MVQDVTCSNTFLQEVFSDLVSGGVSLWLSNWHKKKAKETINILLSEIRKGDLDTVHKDEFLSMLFVFYKSVQEGTAKLNLKLLARLIVGISRKDKKRTKAETFYNHVDMLKNLSEEEIEFLAKCIKLNKVADGEEEIKQSLQNKGFFVSCTKTEMKNRKGVQIRPETKYPSSARVVNETLILNDQAIPYEVNIEIQYEFSTKFNNLLSKYGNLWEDIANK